MKYFLALSLLASTTAWGWDPHPSVPDETIEVGAPRIPGYMFVSEQSHEFKQLSGGGGGGGSPSSEAVNAKGKKKAQKAKAENPSWFSKAFDSASSLVSWDFDSNTGFTMTEAPDGTKSISGNLCLQVAKGSHNTKGCTKTDAVKRPDGKIYIEIKRLIAMEQGRNNWRLVYSTDDTISFLVENVQEVIDAFREIDPSL